MFPLILPSPFTPTTTTTTTATTTTTTTFITKRVSTVNPPNRLPLPPPHFTIIPHDDHLSPLLLAHDSTHNTPVAYIVHPPRTINVTSHPPALNDPTKTWTFSELPATLPTDPTSFPSKYHLPHHPLDITRPLVGKTVDATLGAQLLPYQTTLAVTPTVSYLLELPPTYPLASGLTTQPIVAPNNLQITRRISPPITHIPPRLKPHTGET